MKHAPLARFCLAALCLFASLCPALPSSAQVERRQVLFLNSYQNGYQWSDNILAGVRRVLLHDVFVIDLQVEYMDAKKHPSPASREAFLQLLRTKFADTRFDAVIASDNDALDFLLEHQHALFPHAPVVFCGINDFQPEKLQGRDNFTGVLERLDIGENLRQALALSPDKKRVVVIGDSSLTSLAIEAQIREAVPAFRQRLTFEFWNDLPPGTLLKRVHELPQDTIIFSIPFYTDLGGRYLSAAEMVRAISREARVPVYGAWRFMLGNGIVGGRLLSGEEQGEMAAEMVLDILRGTPVSALPVTDDTDSPYVFDWQELQRFGLTQGPFPENTLFINRPEPIYRLDKKVVWTLAGLFAGLALFSALLARSRNRALRAERSLTLSRKTLRSVIDTIPQLIYWKDTQRTYQGANRRFAEHFGIADPRDVEGRTARELLGENDFSAFGEDADQTALENDAPLLRQTVRVMNDEGALTVFEVNKVPLHDDRGRVAGVLSTAEDITERVNLENQLMQSQKMEAIGTFAGGIAHDFNNLLTTIINSTDLALSELEECGLSGPAAEDIRRAGMAARQGSGLVRQILTYARPGNEGAVPVQPADAVNEALDMVQAMLPGNILLRRRVQDIPRPCLLDPSQLRQVVMNLCTNAFHAMRADGGEIDVRLSLEDGMASGVPPADETAQSGPGKTLHTGEDRADTAAPQRLRLTIIDNGPGIPPEAQARIFDPFYSTKGAGEGTGLGLAIVQGIVQGHGGTVSLASSPGRTRFDILLPHVEGAGEQTAEERPVHGDERVLFVEDNEEQLNLIPRGLDALGYRVHAVRGGQAALDALLGGETCDVVVTDYDMPDLTGADVARTVRQLFPELPVVMVTGGRAAGVPRKDIAALLLKPYSAPRLARTIREVLQDDRAPKNRHGRTQP